MNSSLQAGIAVSVPTSNIFPIAAASASNESSPTIAYDPSRQQYLVAYVNESIPPTAPVINAVCVNQDGGVVWTYVLGDGWMPDAVYDPANDAYFVVWENSTTGNIEASRVAGSCCPQVGCNSVPIDVSGDRPGYEGGPAIAYNEHSSHEDLVIVWYEDENQSDHWGVWGRRMDNGVVNGSSFVINSPPGSYNYEPDVAYNLNMNEFMVVWTRDTSKGGFDNTRDVYSARLWNGASSTGGVIGGSVKAVDATTASQDHPQVAAYRLNQTTPYFVVYRDHFSDSAGDIRGAFLNKESVTQFLINIAINFNIPENYPKVNGYELREGYVVSWNHSTSGGNTDVLWRKVSPEGDLGSPDIVFDGPEDDAHSDIVNSYPFPLGVWMTSSGSQSNIYARFLYHRVFIPAVMRDQ